jgi:hypothetical protein
LLADFLASISFNSSFVWTHLTFIPSAMHLIHGKWLLNQQDN